MDTRIISVIAAAVLVAGLSACSPAQDATTTVASSPSPASVVSTAAAGSTAESVLADNDDIHTSSVEYAEADVREIQLNGTSASSTAAGITIEDGTVRITEPGTYRLSGTLSDGQVVVASPTDGTVRVILAGADITSTTTAALAVEQADDVVILLAEGTSNALTDASDYVYPDPSTDEPNAALFSTADLTIAGAGTLTVTGRSNDGIASKDGLVIASGTLTVDAVDDGIRGKDYLVVDDGLISVTAGGDGLKADNDEDPARGFILVRGGSLEVTSGDDGLSAATDIVMTGGDLGVEALGTGASSDAAKGLVADVALVIADGSVTVAAADDALHSNGVATISGGITTLAAGDDGVHADADLTITGGELEVTRSYEGLESTDMTITGGALTITAQDDGINLAGGDGSALVAPGGHPDDFGARPDGPGGAVGGGPDFEEAGDYHLVITGGQIVIDAGGDGLDSNGTAEMSGGTVVVHGPTSNGNGAIDVNGTFEISGGVLVAVGSAGMAEAPDDSSAQAWIGGSFGSVEPAGTVVAIVSDGTVLATLTAAKPFQSLVYSDPRLVAGQEYEVYVDAAGAGESIGGLTAAGDIAGAEQVGTTTASGAQ